MAYEGDGWQGYNRVFRKNAAANSLGTWATIDGSLWHVEFGGKRMAPHCKHCFSFSHSSTNCAWAPDSGSSTIQPADQSPCNGSTNYYPDYGQCKCRICLVWNNYQYPGSPFPTVHSKIPVPIASTILVSWIKDIHSDSVYIKPRITLTVDQLTEGLTRLRPGDDDYIVI